MRLKSFKPTFWSSMTALILFIMLNSLGFWQMYRYHYKQHLLSTYHLASTGHPLLLAQLHNHSPQAFQHLDIQGTYLNDKTMLLDNRWHHHELGYEVLTPVKIAGQKKAVLVNRGWVVAPPTRQERPHIMRGGSVHDIVGYVNLVNPHVFILGKNVAEPTRWPLRIQKVDIQELQQLTGLKFYPFVLRLDANQPNGFVRHWTIVNIMPQRHLGYAVQWFSMAFALVIAFFAFSWKRDAKQ